MQQESLFPFFLQSAVLEMGRIRGDSTFCPSEVVRWLYPQDWRHFLSDVQTEMMNLYRQGKVVVLQKNKPVDKLTYPKGAVRIRVVKTS
ncbi:MAG: DUF3253 domain-containing protein [Cecembia sp.]